MNAVEVCACSRGYELAADGATCVGKSNGWEGNVDIVRKSEWSDDVLSTLPDVDECGAISSPCDQDCTNTNGSFICSCQDGLMLNDDNRTCSGTS